MKVLKSIHSEPATITLPVVILTSSDAQQDLVEGCELGVNRYVRKPVEFAAFTEAVSQRGLSWMLINRTPIGGNPGGREAGIGPHGMKAARPWEGEPARLPGGRPSVKNRVGVHGVFD